VGREGKVSKEEWRRADRLRALVIYLIGGIAAAVVTAVLYFF